VDKAKSMKPRGEPSAPPMYKELVKIWNLRSVVNTTTVCLIHYEIIKKKSIVEIRHFLTSKASFAILKIRVIHEKSGGLRLKRCGPGQP
jgi:hypothetical protein